MHKNTRSINETQKEPGSLTKHTNAQCSLSLIYVLTCLFACISTAKYGCARVSVLSMLCAQVTRRQSRSCEIDASANNPLETERPTMHAHTNLL